MANDKPPKNSFVEKQLVMNYTLIYQNTGWLSQQTFIYMLLHKGKAVQ